MLPNIDRQVFFVPFPFAANSLGDLALPQDPTPQDTPTGAPGTGTGAPVDPNAPPNVKKEAAPSMFGSDIFLFMALFVGLMLFMSFRKESKARKQQAAMLSSIKQGDQVVTSAGIHGTVHKLADTTVTLLLDSAQVTFERASIARVVRDPANEKADQKSA